MIFIQYWAGDRYAHREREKKKKKEREREIYIYIYRFSSQYRHWIRIGLPLSVFGSPQMWVWPQQAFGGPPPSRRTLPSSQTHSLPPSPSLFPPPPLALCASLRRGRPRLVGGRCPRAQGGGGGGAPSGT